jgi:predicted HNH restriction endonuclease
MTEDELTAAMLEIYRRGGEEVGYWAARFLQSVRGNGGLATAKRMLRPRSDAQRKGLDALLDANRPDLTFEAVVLEDRFRDLFTEKELETAADRLGEYGAEARRRHDGRENLYPDELPLGRKYVEGARKTVRVNAFERSTAGRAACLAHYGTDCAACGMNFEAVYGELGQGFIHVHHRNSLALVGAEHEMDPLRDLIPVCPNCHAMLHRGTRVLEVDELRPLLRGPAA